MDFRGSDSSMILIVRAGILTSTGSFPEFFSQRISAGLVFAGRLGARTQRRLHKWTINIIAIITIDRIAIITINIIAIITINEIATITINIIATITINIITILTINGIAIITMHILAITTIDRTATLAQQTRHGATCQH